MRPLPLSPYQRALDACLGDDVECMTCNWVAQRIVDWRIRTGAGKSTHEGEFQVDPESIARAMPANTLDDTRYGKIIDALNKMTLNSVGLLNLRYEWHEGGDDVLEMPVAIDGAEIVSALHSGVMYSPLTGERVLDFSPHIHLVYIARTDKDPYSVLKA